MELTPEPDINRARLWIDNCLREHPSCKGQCDVSPLPTRVLDVGLRPSNRITLIESNGASAQYVTLSHCWGKVRPFVTDSSNIHERLRSIGVSAIPKTFQDAVSVTQRLGYRFLWIDSLCIIQDSEKDWQTECSKMKNIYGNSTLTIAAAYAKDCNSGFLQERTSLYPKPYIWESTESGRTAIRRISLRQRIDVSNNEPPDEQAGINTFKAESDVPIESRGWILQERLLSPRCIYFGPHRLYWECNAHCRVEDFALPGPTLKHHLGRPGRIESGHISKSDFLRSTRLQVQT